MFILSYRRETRQKRCLSLQTDGEEKEEMLSFQTDERQDRRDVYLFRQTEKRKKRCYPFRQTRDKIEEMFIFSDRRRRREETGRLESANADQFRQTEDKQRRRSRKVRHFIDYSR